MGDEKRNSVKIPLTGVLEIVIIITAVLVFYFTMHSSLAADVRANSEKIASFEKRFDEIRQDLKEIHQEFKEIRKRLDTIQRDVSEVKVELRRK